MRIQDIPVEELIERINDNIDTFAFPHSQISEIDNEESWDDLGQYIGGYELMNLLKKGIPNRAKWYIYDSEQREILYFTSKQTILDAFGSENIELYYQE